MIVLFLSLESQLRCISWTRDELVAELKACSGSKDLARGRRIHQAAIRSGGDRDVYVASALIDMYSKCRSMEHAQGVFDAMANPDTVCWNALILGYVSWGQAEAALALVSQMRRQGCAPDARTLMGALKACTIFAASEDDAVREASRRRGKQLHLLALGNLDAYLQATLVDMYSKCGSMEEARKVFDAMKHRDVVCWNALMLGYADTGEVEVALDLFSRMERQGCAPVSRSFVAALKACTDVAAEERSNLKVPSRRRGAMLHLLASGRGCDSDPYVQATLVNMFAKCGSMRDARRVFESMRRTDVVSWNALMLGYVDNGEAVQALDAFRAMKHRGCAPDARTLAAAIKACTRMAVQEKGEAVLFIACCTGCDSDIHLQSSLVDMYASIGSMQRARCVFDTIKQPDVVCWNALISGYGENGQAAMALECFALMKVRGLAPDPATYVAALKACYISGALNIGREIHAELCTRGLERGHVVLTNCLVHFYARCGSLAEARQVFESQTSRLNLITWTSLIAGYSCHGDTENVFHLFDRMLDAGLQPNAVTLLCVLTACSHTGLLEEGKKCFETAFARHGVDPGLEHYTCMVDMLGRANKLADAMAFLRRMHLSPGSVAWTSVLAACRKWKNARLASLALESLTSLADSTLNVCVSSNT